ncbi:MAG: hypothetical protein HGA44_04265 [Cellulomonadaceae bacterium]|nr:hypothetical protein [Cellulomonadaceae bacterium]
MTTDQLVAQEATVVLHGMHPLRGYPVTWHLTPLHTVPGETPLFRVESADGEIDDDVVWQLAERHVTELTGAEVRSLVRRVGGF